MFRGLPDFFRGYLLFLSLAFVALVLLEHGEMVLWVNRNSTPVLNVLMPWLTYVGDGIFYACIALVVIAVRWRIGLVFAVAGIVMSGVVSLLKRVVFRHVPRPKRFFAESESLSFIEGVRVASNFSFPSGHSASIFLLCTLLALVLHQIRWAQWALLLVAMAVAFSRVYILQHFFIDIVGGSIVGVTIGLVCWRYVRPAMGHRD